MKRERSKSSPSTSSNPSRNKVWSNIRILLKLGFKPIRIAARYSYRGIDPQMIRMKNFRKWKIDAKSGSMRGSRCPSCRKRRPTEKENLCRKCLLAKRRRGRPRGKDAPSWKGGVTQSNPRMSPRYKRFREYVLRRDGYCCVWCGSKEKLEVDHIKSQKDYPELRYDPRNGRTLCESCHRKTPTWGSKVHRRK